MGQQLKISRMLRANSGSGVRHIPAARNAAGAGSNPARRKSSACNKTSCNIKYVVLTSLSLSTLFLHTELLNLAEDVVLERILLFDDLFTEAGAAGFAAYQYEFIQF